MKIFYLQTGIMVHLYNIESLKTLDLIISYNLSKLMHQFLIVYSNCAEINEISKLVSFLFYQSINYFLSGFTSFGYFIFL